MGKRKQFLVDLINIPSPSGAENKIQHFVNEYVKGDSSEIDAHGNLIISKKAKITGGPSMMLAGHCDQIGFIITYIDPQGYLYFDTVGGWDPQQILGQNVTIWTNEKQVPGIVSRKPVHLIPPKQRATAVKATDMWIDIGVKNYKQATKLVAVGDYVTLDLKLQMLENNLITGPGLDDKIGVWIASETLRKVSRKALQGDLSIVSTVQEEIGTRGAITSAYNVNPDIGIAIDVGHASDYPTVNKKQIGDVSLGKGPIIYKGPNLTPSVVDRLIAACDDNKIPYQICADGGVTGTDARSIQVNRGGVATALIGIPCRYMHSAVEVVSYTDMKNAVKMLVKFCSR